MLSICLALVLMKTNFIGRHAVGLCWIQSTPNTINWFLLPPLLSSRASWEFLFAFVLIIYTISAILLMLMARCLNRLPVIQETLLRARAEALESMMFYVFIYIIYGLCLCVLYGLNVMINYRFQSWDPRFVSSYVLELVRFPNSSFTSRSSTCSSPRAGF